MKNLKIYLAIFVMMPFLFSSCTKDETVSETEVSPDVAVLYLGPVLEGLNQTRQQESDIPQCTDDEAAFASIRLTYGPNNTPVEVTVEILEDEQGLFTAYDDKLEIPVVSGNSVEITLTDFVVLNDNQKPIWMAPKLGSDFAKFVSHPLSRKFDLRAGSKHYVNVDVLCFDDRVVNLYGYQFFDITQVPLYKFCVFANYCSDSGRHFTADYEFSLYKYLGDDPENPLQLASNYQLIHEDESPVKGNDDGTYWADPLCMVIPGKPKDKGPNDAYLFYEIKLLNWAPYYATDGTFEKSGYLTWNQIQDLLTVEGDDTNSTVDYWHFFFNCGDDDGPVECDINDPEADCDNDGKNNGDENDECKNDPDPNCGVDPCTNPTTWYEDADGDGLGDPAVSQDACERPDGYVDNKLDQCPDENPGTDTNGDGCEDEVQCDLNDPNEDCDGDGTLNGVDCDPDNPAVTNSNANDADCDGVPTDVDCDDDDPSIGIATTRYYEDADGDGLGDPDVSQISCTQPLGFVSNSLDLCPNSEIGAPVNSRGCEISNCGIAYFGKENMIKDFELLNANNFVFPLQIFVDATTVSGLNTNIVIGTIRLSIDETTGDLIVSVSIEENSAYEVTDYFLAASNDDNGSVQVNTSYDETSGNPGEVFQDVVKISDLPNLNISNLYFFASFNVCEK